MNNQASNQPFLGTPHLALLAPNPDHTNPDVDTCDLAEGAMPALILGELDEADVKWVHQHTATCNYCRNILSSFEECDAVLDTCEQAMEGIASQRPQSTASLLGLKEAAYGFMDTPVGPILIAVTEGGVCEISYLGHTDKHQTLRGIEERGILPQERQTKIGSVVDELGSYFGGDRTTFDLPVDLHGVTDFTRKVLHATNHVPFGAVTTYGDIARVIGNPGSSRAVGNALGKNPVPVIIPCHRVILSSGEMGWYTGGPDIKRTLLNIEGVATKTPANQISLSL